MNQPEILSTISSLKQEIRQQAHDNRRNQPDKDPVSARIVERFMSLPE